MSAAEIPWRRGFDHGTDTTVIDGHPDVWDELREGSRAFRSDAMPWTLWYLTRFEDVQAGFQLHNLFSSAQVNYNVDDTHQWIPAQVDPPNHTKYRVLLNPLFSARAVAEMEPDVRSLARTLAIELAESNGGDFIDRFAHRLPSSVFMALLGLPVEQADTFLGWAKALLHTSNAQDPTGTIRKDASRTIYRYLGDQIVSRRSQPTDDVISRLLAGEVDGRPVTDAEVREMCFLLYVAGMDTTAGTLGYTFRHLATHPEHRRLLIDEPGRIDAFVDECLRYYSTVATSRVVRDDVEFAECPMRSGDRIVLSTTGANRDPRQFADADQFVPDRQPNRHIAFGAGIHRCVGAPLARMELRVAVDEWLRVIPDFAIADDAVITQHVGGAAGLDQLALVW